jgi:hypothetical protein
MVSRTSCKRPWSLSHDDFSFENEKIRGIETLFRDRAKIKRKRSTGEIGDLLWLYLVAASVTH